MEEKDQINLPKIEALLEYADSIIATLREPFLVLDKKLQIISANRAFYITFRVAEKDTIGRPLPELGDGQWNVPGLLKLLKEIIPEKKILEDYEVKHKFEHIGEKIICLNARQLRVSKEISAIVAPRTREEELILLAIEDITERRRLQTELKESEERYRRAFETSRDGLLLIHKTEGGILNSNESAQELLGYSHDEFLEKKLWAIGMVKDAGDFKEMTSILERDGVIHYEDAPVKTKEGLSINSEVFLVDKAKVIQCNIRDITERRKVEDALRTSEESYRTIFESANDAIIIMDVKTYGIVDANRVACRMFRYPKEEMKGIDFESLSTDSTQYTVEKLKFFYDKASNGDPQLFEWLAKDKFGREFWIEVNVKRAIIAKQYRLLYIARDITERRQLSEQKDSFMNMVSHELRTPLGAIKESVSLIAEGKVGSIDEKEKEMIDIAKRNVDRLSRLINDVLDLQKIDAGMMKCSISQNDMNKAIEDVYRSMVSMASKKGLNFVLDLDDNLPGVKFDKDKILQVLMNFVNNAIKFTEKGDITIVSSKGDNFIRVSVKDTGPGIKTEDLSKLFQRFSQLKRIPGGTGLGLAISKEIIDMHRGKVGAESEFGKGTTFSFILPIKDRRV